LGRNNSDKHQSHVELGVDDPAVKSDTRRDNSWTSMRICREREIQAWLDHASITEKYLGGEQEIKKAVDDRLLRRSKL
jgi:hypothetical protein